MNPSLVVTLIVAGIGAGGLIIIRLIRKPVDIQELWAENRSLRAEVSAARSDNSKLTDRIALTERTAEDRDRSRLDQIEILSSAIGVLEHRIEILIERWSGSEPIPEMSVKELALITAATHIRATHNGQEATA